jgi:hypothetical protein
MLRGAHARAGRPAAPSRRGSTPLRVFCGASPERGLPPRQAGGAGAGAAPGAAPAQAPATLRVHYKRRDRAHKVQRTRRSRQARRAPSSTPRPQQLADET